MTREVDALVAEEVFGCNARRSENGFLYCMDREPPTYMPRHGDWDNGWILKYSTDIAAAWEVKNALVGRGWRFYLRDTGKSCAAEFQKGDASGISTGWVEAKTAPLAICRAALLVVMDAGQEVK